jgi:altronate hydrolase
MDINCGSIIDSTMTLEESGQQIFAEMIAVASGKRTRSEIHGFGQDEFQPWILGAVI